MNDANSKEVSEPGSPNSSHREKQRGIWWVMKWGLVFFFLLVVALVFLNFRTGPGVDSPLVRVSAGTTYVTSPLKPNGDPDYVAFLNQQRAVTPDNNALVDLLRIMGPMSEPANKSPEFYKLLGMEPLSEKGDYLEHISLSASRGNPAIDISATVDGVLLDEMQVFEVTLSYPFAKGDFPAVDQWFARNEHHLLAIRQAVKKPGFYFPFVGGSLVYGYLSITEFRELVRSLCRSSMVRLGRGDVTGAIDDQIAILRLDRHLGNQGSITGLLVGTSIVEMGNGMIAITLFSGKCTADDLARMAAEIDSLPNLPVVNNVHLETERVYALDLAFTFGRAGQQGEFDQATRATINDRLWIASIDWEIALQTLNGFYDSLERDLGLASMQQRVAAFDNFEQALKDLESGNSSIQSKIRSTMAGRAARGKRTGEWLAVQTLPSMSLFVKSDRKNIAQNLVTRAAVAVEQYRMEHGEYPKTLNALVPEFLAEVPVDPYSGKQLVYRPDPVRLFRLYSIGPNEKDDDGIGYLEAKDSDYDLPAVPKILSIDEWLEASGLAPGKEPPKEN